MGINKVLCYLFEGPPGTGKTFAVQCLSKELELKIDHVNFLRLENEGTTISEALHTIFDNAMREEECILFIDEAEKLLGKEDFGLSDGPLQGELQQLIDGFSEFNKRFKGIIIFNVNQISSFSNTMLDRFKIVHFSTPNDADRYAYLQKKIDLLEQNMTTTILNEITINELTKITAEFSYRQIDRLWTEIILLKLEEQDEGSKKPITNILHNIKLPSITYFG